MNLLDALIVLAAVAAAAAGYRLGFVTRASAWAGLAVGVLAGSRLAPTVTRLFGDARPDRMVLVTTLTLLGCALLGQLVGQSVGLRLRTRARPGYRQAVDRAAGALSGIVAVLAAVWLLTPLMTGVAAWPSDLASGSLVARSVDELTPDPPNATTAASFFLGRDQWAELQRSAAGGVPRAELGDAAPDATLEARARAATVLVQRAGCGRGNTGTGFAVAGDLVITNAHVVAGSDAATVEIRDAAGRDRDALVVAFDATADLALLAVPGLDVADPLPLSTETGAEEPGWVFGHPGGGGLRIRTFIAGPEQDAEIGDIYDEGVSARRIRILKARLEEGDSGSPLVAVTPAEPAGAVVGVAFARSPDNPEMAAAVSVGEVEALLDADGVDVVGGVAVGSADQVLARVGGEVDTGRCVGR